MRSGSRFQACWQRQLARVRISRDRGQRDRRRADTQIAGMWTLSDSRRTGDKRAIREQARADLRALRERTLSAVSDPYVINYWKLEFPNLPKGAIDPITNQIVGGALSASLPQPVPVVWTPNP